MFAASSSVDDGAGGLKTVRLRLEEKEGGRASEASVTLYGAHVTGWEDADGGGPVLFLSSRAAMDGSRPVRGGVPIIFPQFSGFGPLPKHGFARDRLWELRGVEVADGGGAVTAVLALAPSDETRAMAGDFACEYRVTLARQGNGPSTLRLELRVANEAAAGGADLGFAAALHTYFRVRDVAGTSVSAGGNGTLAGGRYVDQLQEHAELVQKGGEVTFAAEVDRMYRGVPPHLVVRDGARAIHIRASASFPDAVVWNPWVDKARSMSDLADDEYRQFVCVESAALDRVSLAPGGTWTGSVEMRVE